MSMSTFADRGYTPLQLELHAAAKARRERIQAQGIFEPRPEPAKPPPPPPPPPSPRSEIRLWEQRRPSVVAHVAGSIDAARYVIQQEVAAEYGLSVAEMLSGNRKLAVIAGRMLSIYFCLHMLDDVGAALGRAYGLDHSTIGHANRVISNRIEDDSGFALLVGRLRARIEPRLAEVRAEAAARSAPIRAAAAAADAEASRAAWLAEEKARAAGSRLSMTESAVRKRIARSIATAARKSEREAAQAKGWGHAGPDYATACPLPNLLDRDNAMKPGPSLPVEPQVNRSTSPNE